MGVVIPQVITEDRASGAQIIDGSLRFDSGSSHYLNRTPSSAGNRQTWTWSGWVKLGKNSVGGSRYFFAGNSAQTNTGFTGIGFENDEIFIAGWATNWRITTQKFRDYGAWYHIVLTWDTTQATANDRVKLYVNGSQVTAFSTTNNPAQDADGGVNTAAVHYLSTYNGSASLFDGYLAEVNFIDGSALDASYFGFTDPLTNTWRPKKYTGTYGTNGFYLPLDGNSLIGEDKSGNGNDWTPVSFGGSNTLEKATGALPILNTVNGGNVAVPGVFGSKVSKTLTTTASTNTSNGFVFENEGTKPTLSFVRGATYTFDYSASTSHPLRFATAADAVGSTEYTDGTNTSVANTVKITVPHNAPDTLYYYCTNHSGMGNSISVTTDEKVADPYAWKNVLALPLVGSSADVSNRINSGRTALTFTAQGNAAPTTTQSNFYGGSYTFDGTGDSLYAYPPNSDALFLQNSNFTVECWVRIASGQTNDRYLLCLANNNATNSAFSWTFRINGSKFQGIIVNSNTQYLTTSANNYVPDKWTHVAYVREGNEQRLYVDGVLSSTTSHSVLPNLNDSSTLNVGAQWNDINSINGQIQDIRIYDNIAKYTSNFIPASTNPDILPDTPSGVAGGSALTKVTDGAVSLDGSGDYLELADSDDWDFGTGDFTIECYTYFNNTTSFGNSTMINRWGDDAYIWTFQIVSSTQNLRFYTNSGNLATPSNSIGPYKWYHFAAARSSGTLKLFIDGVESASGSFTVDLDGTSRLNIGAQVGDENLPTNGLISNVRIIKGTALYTSSFTPPTNALTNVTNTKLLCCQSTTSATAAAVAPGSITANGNASATNFNPFTTDINAVRGQESGYATLNPLNTDNISTFSDGNLSTVCSTGVGQGCSSGGNIGVSSGKWYCEMVCTAKTATNALIGICTIDGFDGQRQIDESQNGGSGYGYVTNGTRVPGGTSYGTTWTVGDIMGIAMDLDSAQNTVTFYKNGVSQGAINITNARYVFGCSNGQGSSSVTYSVNFGQKPFKYNPPEGFKTLCLANLPRPTEAAVRPDKYFNTVLWTGTGVTNRITGVGFQPDFVWIKKRNGSEQHELQDSVRGATKRLSSNLTDAETTVAGSISSFDRDGFTVVDAGSTNEDTYTYVAWCWKAGGAAVENTDGTITSQVSANRDAGFSIVTYTGAGGNSGTVGHGLNVTPKIVIAKARGATDNWVVYTDIIDGSNDFIKLNSTDVKSDSSHATTTSTTFNPYYSQTSTNYVAYCWHDVPGFSKFGSFEGNDSQDGCYVHLGFKPALVIAKQVDTAWTVGGSAATSWGMWDSARMPNNPGGNPLWANKNGTESIRGNNSSANTGGSDGNGLGGFLMCDLLSNGFKAESAGSEFNSAGTHIYMAWAEIPTINLYGTQAPGR